MDSPAPRPANRAAAREPELKLASEVVSDGATAPAHEPREDGVVVPRGTGRALSAVRAEQTAAAGIRPATRPTLSLRKDSFTKNGSRELAFRFPVSVALPHHRQRRDPGHCHRRSSSTGQLGRVLSRGQSRWE
jgi:hypothetical protein